MNPQPSDTDFPVKKRPAPNANHQKQPRFFSTKKKRVVPKRWAKPSKDERDTCYGTLESVEISHCAIVESVLSKMIWNPQIWLNGSGAVHATFGYTSVV